MTATQLFNGEPLAETLLEEIAARLRGLDGGLTVLHDPRAGGAAAYAGRIADYAARIALPVEILPYPQTEDAMRQTAECRTGPVLLLTPAPPGLDLGALRDQLGPDRDPEGLHPLNSGPILNGTATLVPPTARAAHRIARHIAGPLDGAVVAVVGASAIVGRPLALRLLDDGATVRIAQASTRDLGAETRAADVVISATGVPGLLGRDHLQPGAIAIDVGVTRVGARLVGDFDAASVLNHAAWLTEVPDGVGPVTTACLLYNAVTCLSR